MKNYHSISWLVCIAALTGRVPEPLRRQLKSPHGPPTSSSSSSTTWAMRISVRSARRAMRRRTLDRMAAEGMKFTDFVVSSAVCSASRVALMTGCYHRRVGIDGALGPRAEVGIDAGEMTLGEVCKQKGYATACFGKWHLGHHPKFLPLQHGFDEYFGLPYSNDMWPLHPDYLKLPPDAANKKSGFPPLPLIEGNRVIDAEVTSKEQESPDHLVHRTCGGLHQPARARAVLPVRAAQHGACSAACVGQVPRQERSRAVRRRGDGSGLVGGRDPAAIQKNGLDENTLVIFTADNGPWLSYGDHAGSAGSAARRQGHRV